MKKVSWLLTMFEKFIPEPEPKEELIMSSQFQIALAHVFHLEGGYVNDPIDSGGETKYGITHRVWAEYNNNKIPYPIKNITKADAEAVYYRMFWVKPKLPSLENGPVSQILLTNIFDAAVNHGPGNGIKFIQRACNFIRRDSDPILAEDGILGPKSINMINTLARLGYNNALLGAFRGKRFQFYESIVTKNTTQRRFIRGWMTRLV